MLLLLATLFTSITFANGTPTKPRLPNISGNRQRNTNWDLSSASTSSSSSLSSNVNEDINHRLSDGLAILKTLAEQSKSSKTRTSYSSPSTSFSSSSSNFHHQPSFSSTSSNFYHQPSSSQSSRPFYNIDSRPSSTKSDGYRNQHVSDGLDVLRGHAYKSKPKSFYTSEDTNGFRGKQYKCNEGLCSVRCSTQEKLDNHKKDYHRGQKDEYRCKKCTKLFSSAWRLDKHQEQC